MKHYGEEINYFDWYPSDDALRELTADGMDKYFNHFSGEAAGADKVEEGTPVVGYRFMYKRPDGVYRGPFVSRIYGEGMETAINKRGFSFLTPEENEYVRHEWGRRRECWYGGAATTVTDDQEVLYDDRVNVDTQGRGYYYWPDRGMAEDYMKAFFSRFHKEDNGAWNFLHITYKPKKFSMFRKNKYKREIKFYASDYEDGPTYPRYMYNIHETPGGSTPDRLAYNLPEIPTGPVTKKPQGYLGNTLLYLDSDLGLSMHEYFENIPIDLGTYELHRVTGIAKKNTYGDSGFIMNEMVIDPEPLISIGVNEPFETKCINKRREQLAEEDRTGVRHWW